MAKNNKSISNKNMLNYGKHRQKYQKEIFKLIEELKNTPNEKKAEKIDNYLVLKLYTLLRNFGIYKDDDVYDIVKYFKENELTFYIRLENYLNSIENKRKIYKALFVIKNQILNIRDFSSNGFYTDFLDDLKSELGFTVSNMYNNFIEPSIYIKNDIEFSNNSEIVKQIIQKHEITDTFEADYNNEPRKNKAIAKNLQKAYKEVSNA